MALNNMQIDIIDDFETLNNIRKDWDFVYAADQQAQFFLSWVWLSGWLHMISEPWFILAAKPDINSSSYVGFLPLKIVLNQEDGGYFNTELYMAGNSMADYTGIICLPSFEEEVIFAFANYIQQQLLWSNFHAKNILETDTRMSLFLRNFSGDRFNFIEHRVQNIGEDTDNYIAPYLALVDDWNEYLQNFVSSNTRQKIRRFLRKIESSDEFRITHVDADNLDSHIEILMRLWETKWRDKKGDNFDVITDYIRMILRHCFENKCLYFPVLWKGDTPVGAIANYVDVHQKSMLFFITGRDETFTNPPPGLILHADAIRYAIQNGFKVYDFLRGNEEYKYSFGSKERRIQHIIVEDKDSQKKLDVRFLPLVLQVTAHHHRANQLIEAEQGYRQILEVQSNHPDALHGLGMLMRQKGDYQTAENLLKSVLEIQPNSTNVLFSLGNLYLAQSQLSEAIAAYNQVLILQPKAVPAYNNLGYALQQQSKWSDAIACYENALSLQPDCIEAEVNLANALHAQGKLSPEKQAHYAVMNNDLGSKCRQAGDLKTAIAYYQQSIAMNPDMSDAHHNLSLVLQEAQAQVS